MTRQEEWGMQEGVTAELFTVPKRQTTGRCKRNTRSRGEYNGFTKTAVVKLTEKKPGYVYTKAEKDAMTAYYDERLANAGASVSAGTPDGYTLLCESETRKRALDPNISCGSIECRPEKWIHQGGTR